MLGVRKSKKTKPVRVRSAPSSDGDDGSGGDARRRIQKHRKKKKEAKGDSSWKKKAQMKATIALSFDPEDGGNEEEVEPRKKSKKRAKHSLKQRKRSKRSGGGLGYGGLGVMPVDTSDSSSDVEGWKTKKEGGEGGNARGGNYYDAAALARLRSEQKRSTVAKEDAVKIDPAAPSMVYETSEAVKDEDKSPMQGQKAEENVEEEEFIPLSGGIPGTPPSVADPVVLTGEEAMAYTRGEEEDGGNLDFDHGLHSPPTPPGARAANDEKDITGEVAGMDVNADPIDTCDPPEEVEEGNRRWEDTMARRAGVLPPKAAPSSENNGRSRWPRKQSNDFSLSQIRASLQPMVSNLKNVRYDLETSIRRHEFTMSSAREELTKHRSALEDHGEALEHYQALREDLATWVGALRELKGMVERIEAAKRKLEAEMTQRRRERLREWREDCAEVLERQGLLDRQGGGGGEIRLDEAASWEVDEFGRDLSSMASMARVQRWNQRRERCIKRLRDSKTDDDDDGKLLRQSTGCSNEDNLDDCEIKEWNKRHEALINAVAIVPDLVKDEYLSMSNLCKIFFNWESRYPNDYVNCYAEMSLVQMITVLVRLELCERWDVLGLHRKSNVASCVDVTEFEWFQHLKRLDDLRRSDRGGAEKTDRKAKRKCILVEVVQKQIVNRLLTSLSCDDGKDGNEQHEIYDSFSATQTQRVCSMLMSSLKYISTVLEGNGEAFRRDTAGKVLSSLLSSLKEDVEDMAIIANASKITLMKNRFAIRDSTEELESETADAIAYATVIQTKKLCTLVENILQWYAIINREFTDQESAADSLAQFMFEELISSWIMPILQSLHDMSFGGYGNSTRYYEMPNSFVSHILDAMQDANLLNDKWMLMAAPLRALTKRWGDNGP